MDDVFQILAVFGGVAAVILASAKAKLMHRLADRAQWQQTAAPRQDDAVLAELKSLKQQMNEMQSTSHQFDISFDAALERMEGRVNRLETRDASRAGQPSSPTESQTVQAGRP